MLMFALTRPTEDGTPRTDTYADADAALFNAPVDFRPGNGRPQAAAVPPLSDQTVGLLRAVRCLRPKPGDPSPDSIVGDLSGGLLKVDIDQFWQRRLPENSAHIAFATVTMTTTNGQYEHVSEQTLLAPDDPRYLTDTLPYIGREHPPPDKAGAVYSTHWRKPLRVTDTSSSAAPRTSPASGSGDRSIKTPAGTPSSFAAPKPKKHSRRSSRP